MKKRSYGSNHLRFLLAAIVIIVLVDHYIFDGTRPYIEEARREVKDSQAFEREAEYNLTREHQSKQIAEHVKIAKVDPVAKVQSQDIILPKLDQKLEPLWRQHSIKFENKENKPVVVIVLDDLGMKKKASYEAINLPGPLTLAFLPYASRLKTMTDQAKEGGHELIVHFPMEPLNPKIDTGSIVLTSSLNQKEFTKVFDEGLGAFGGYVGLNNHMGSLLTQSSEAMEMLMIEVSKRGLLFLDSKTIASSVAIEMAVKYGVPYAERDVFLDHETSETFILDALERLENIAKKKGYAIGIGHPNSNTIKSLQKWLPTLEGKNIVLAPLSHVIQVPGDKTRKLSGEKVQSHFGPHQ